MGACAISFLDTAGACEGEFDGGDGLDLAAVGEDDGHADGELDGLLDIEVDDAGGGAAFGDESGIAIGGETRDDEAALGAFDFSTDGDGAFESLFVIGEEDGEVGMGF